MERERRLVDAYVKVPIPMPPIERTSTRNAIWLNDCHAVAASIGRHVDGIGFVRVKEKWIEVCLHCDCEFEAEVTGEPMCCTAAHDEWVAEELSRDQAEKKRIVAEEATVDAKMQEMVDEVEK